MIGGISSLSSLEKLCLFSFEQLGHWPAEVAATLRPLHRLRALVGGTIQQCLPSEAPSHEAYVRRVHGNHIVTISVTTCTGSVTPVFLQALNYCSLQENPAKDILTRLTLLSLSGNSLKTLPDALPAGTVHNLKLLDLSDNAQLSRQPAGSNTWAAEDIVAFESGWASLQVLGMQPRFPGHVDKGLMATAKVVQRLLQRQADAAEPRRLPATVVYDCSHHYELLLPALCLAEIWD